MMQIEFSGTNLAINSTDVTQPYPIIDAFETRGVVVVLLDPDANMGKNVQYKNLLAYDASGRKLWEAEMPTSKTSDVYWKLAKKEPLIVYSFSSYECEIDIATGRIVRADFYK